MQIFEIVNDNISKGLSNRIELNLEHDGYEVIQIQNLDSKTNGNNAGSIINLEDLDNSDNKQKNKSN